MTAYAYLHGFASSPLSTKGVHLAGLLETRGLLLNRPDLNRPSFDKLTFTGALASVDDMAAELPEDTRWCLIGSSMGGYIAALWASLHPRKVERLVLLCPGFALAERWPEILGDGVFGHWRQSGFCTFPDGAGQPTPVHWGFVEDARSHPKRPDVSCPTLILHGRRDETVPIESSRTYAATRPHVQLVELDDEHSLSQSIDRIASETLSFWEL